MIRCRRVREFVRRARGIVPQRCASGIPTRVVSGLAYCEDMQGFLYHSGVESLVGPDGFGVDPTFGESPTDATHFRVVESEQLADLLRLLDWAGWTKIRVLAAEPAQR